MLRLMITVICLYVVIPLALSQGCSDAGVCSINAHQKENKKLAWSLSQSAELGENMVFYFHTTMGMLIPIGNHANVVLGLPYRNAVYKGNLYTGFSDATLASSFLLGQGYSFTAGIKIPLSESNKMKDGEPLPMALQQGLGTFDAMIAISKKWNVHQLTAGYQYVFGMNNNAFMGDEDFGASAQLERGDDLMLRYDRFLDSEKNWKAFLISVYRIGGDKINDGEKVENSEGLSLNVAVFRNIKLGERALELMIAAPIVARKARVDGLTRNFIISAKLNGIF